MTIDDQIKDEEFQNDINKGAAKISAHHHEKSISMNILQVKKYYLNLLILLLIKLFKNKNN